MPLCLSAGAAAAVVAANAFTLAWTHSIEKTRWEEDWLVEDAYLSVVAARIQGSGAGMEPPADAVLRGGTWHYRSKVAPLPRLLLSHSPYAGSYELCVNASCRPVGDYLAGLPREATLVLAPCANGEPE
ncbi:MAG TPA: DUF1850 domain-containing protein [Accumulibacter sp.]|uniref:DUF1850 domain-containing protein n=1 Tax=Accumulibacter sp. TaxID=2053492 RepID=UPI002C175880|nr:DUF1850 domain-containing protein [Accumulibacter sp.]HRF74339.1 DUF1850 domain-containing protein [Accumulibacter sp.]